MTAPDFDGFLVSTGWLAAHLSDPDLVVVDVTAGPAPLTDPDGAEGAPRAAFAAARIPGARFLDLKADFSDPAAPFGFTAPAPDALAAALGRAGIGNAARVVIYSNAGWGWAARFWWLLRSVGFTNAALLDGGRRLWTAEGRPLESGPAPDPVPATFQVSATPAVFVDKAAVLAALDHPDARVVNALPAAAHSGKAESKHGRRGHIAGSVNVPQADLVDPATNRLRDPAALAERFAAAGVTAEAPVITYCGGGIAAAVDAFALARLGAADVTIYDNSLAEWARDPALPMSAPAAPADPVSA